MTRPSETDFTRSAARRLRRLGRRYRRRLESAPFPRELNEECGVFGVIGTPDAAALTALGLHALQHRGQEAAGIASFDGAAFRTERHLGLVSENFSDAAVLARLAGNAAIGHTRYSTQGETVLKNVQPLYADLDRDGIAVAHNGNLTNARKLRTELKQRGCIFQSTSDSELFLHLTARSHHLLMVDKLIDALKQVEGAYALTILTKEGMIGARDPVGIRPLILGDLNGAPILASETCALDLIGAKFVRDIRPGEVIICRPTGEVESRQAFPQATPARPCIFELIYFARPNSIVDGKSVYQLRKSLGARLAVEARVDADMAAPIPDSGVPAAIGYAQASGLPYEMALIRSHFVGRTFIEPEQRIREAGVARKHSPNRGAIEGKRIVLIDDSIVRGTTSRKIVQMLRNAGAREVHMRVACPPILYPDFYGIDTPSRAELIAAQMSVDEIRAEIGVDSLAFLSLDGLYEAFGKGRRDKAAPAFTDHCFTGDYPTRLTDLGETQRSAMIEQLSLLAETS
ncbi:MAG TPA: amidophosphoribosyltransferase [Parvularcula sp.]|nr:amidophosphoribosyltransferase [Parvularcula sp.]HBS30330.1 amidophosphoribosyltransferase [Parvularcula sp.]HBS36088.1 amidophosphoribosyltransferase [Parvularcula sp.]